MCCYLLLVNRFWWHDNEIRIARKQRFSLIASFSVLSRLFAAKKGVGGLLDTIRHSETVRKERMTSSCIKSLIVAFAFLTTLVSSTFSGKCSVEGEGTEMQLTADQVLAMTAETEVAVKVLESTRLVVVSVPRDPKMSPKSICLKSLDDIINSELDVDWVTGKSRRFLVTGDGFNIGVHNTTITANCALQYRRHMEGVYVIEGEGTTYTWEGGQKSQTFLPSGTMFLMDENDAHKISICGKGGTAICVFFPPLQGHETHFKENMSGGCSSY